MRITQRMLVDTVRSNINTNAESLTALQDQLSSGKRLRKPSDDPQALGRALKLRSNADQNAQFLRNISSARGWLEATDTSLAQLSEALLRARDLAVKGASDTLSADERRNLAYQLDGMLDEAIQCVNSAHEGKHLFAGRRVSTPPFALSADRSAVEYRGDSGEMGRDIASSANLPVNVPGDMEVEGVQILPQALAALVELRDRLNDGTGVGVSGTLDQLSQCLEGVATLRGTVGARTSRLNATEDGLDQVQVRIATMLSRAEDADIADTISRLTMQQNVFTAALAVGARTVQMSLLNFLK